MKSILDSLSRIFVILLLLVGRLLSESATAAEPKPFAPAEVQLLCKDAPTYFYSDLFSAAIFYQFNPDGRYVVIAREHLGVWPIDDGTWSQDEDGVVTLVSVKECADIISGPLSIQVGSRRNIPLLPQLLSKINDLLNSVQGDDFKRADLEALKAGKTDVEEAIYPIEIQTDWENSFSRSTVIALVSNITEFLENSERQNVEVVPLAYRGKVFLISLNQVVNNDYSRLCKAIDEGQGPGSIDVYHPFKIDEFEFSEGTGTPYPFKFFPELNSVTGAK